MGETSLRGPCFPPCQVFTQLWICCHGLLTLLVTPLSENEFLTPHLVDSILRVELCQRVLLSSPLTHSLAVPRPSGTILLGPRPSVHAMSGLPCGASERGWSPCASNSIRIKNSHNNHQNSCRMQNIYIKEQSRLDQKMELDINLISCAPGMVFKSGKYVCLTYNI